MLKIPIYTTFIGDGEICFLRIHKNASSSLSKVFEQRKGGSIRRLDPPAPKIFAIIRGTVDRCISGYRELNRKRDRRAMVSFDDYVKDLKGGPWDPHQVSQSDYLLQFHRRFEDREIDKYYLFDQLDELEKDLDIILPHVNKSLEPTLSMSGETIKTIQEIYMEDWYLYRELSIEKEKDTEK